MSAERGSGFVSSIVYTRPERQPPVYKPYTSLEPTSMNTLRDLSLTDLTQEQGSSNEIGFCQIRIATAYYLHLPLLYHTYDLWHQSCATVQAYAGIVWSLSFQPIVPAVIARSPFLLEAIPTLGEDLNPIVIAQLTGTWKGPKDTAACEPIVSKLIGDIDAAAEKERMQTDCVYLNYAHKGQNVYGEGKRREWLREVSGRYDPDRVFQRCVPGGFKLF